MAQKSFEKMLLMIEKQYQLYLNCLLNNLIMLCYFLRHTL